MVGLVGSSNIAGILDDAGLGHARLPLSLQTEFDDLAIYPAAGRSTVVGSKENTATPAFHETHETHNRARAFGGQKPTRKDVVRCMYVTLPSKVKLELTVDGSDMNKVLPMLVVMWASRKWDEGC